jgi:predicted deacylase
MKKICTIIGGQHGDEPTGVRICQMLYPMKSASIVIIPCVNPIGYKSKTRELNGTDLNRSYQQNNDPIVTKIIEIVKSLCKLSSLVIDVHSTHAHMLDKACFLTNDFATQYRDCFTIDEAGNNDPEGSLRWFCNSQQIPMITYEAVEFDPIDQDQVNLGVDEILAVMTKAGFN